MIKDKTWGIEDAIFFIMLEVGSLNIEVENARNHLDHLINKRASLDIGLRMLVVERWMFTPLNQIRRWSNGTEESIINVFECPHDFDSCGSHCPNWILANPKNKCKLQEEKENVE